MKYKSKDSAIETVKMLFQDVGEDTLMLDDIFLKFNRDLGNKEKNKSWFSNKLVPLKYHNLVGSKYSFANGRKTLVGIQLTMEGKKLLGRIGDQQEEIKQQAAVNNLPDKLMQAMKSIAELRAEMPEYEITFDMKLKDTGQK